MLLFAVRLDNAIPAALLPWIGWAAIAALVISFFHAGLLCLAAAWLRLGPIGYRRALGSILPCNIAFFGIGALTTLTISAAQRPEGPYMLSYSNIFLQPGVNYIYLFAALVLGHAAVFSHRLEASAGLPLRFGQASALALLYVGLCSLLSVGLWIGVQIVRGMMRGVS